MNTRDAVKTLFLAHASTSNITEIVRLTLPYMYRCRMNWVPHVVCLLVCSHDYWDKRLHMQQKRRHQITLFVVWRHDSCLPYPVFCLEDGREYLPYTCAVDPSRRTRRTARAFLGQLLCGVQAAFDQLSTMPPSSKRRYERLLDTYTCRRKGRPLKVS